MISIYTHLSPNKFSFFSELEHSNYTFSDIPEYAIESFKQTEKHLKTPPIILTNTDIDKNFKKEIDEFYQLCKNGFPSFYKDPFWLTTLLRLYVVFLYCEKHNINEFIHLEYDNLIYSDLKELTHLPQSLYFTRVGPFCSSAGFVFCNSLEHFRKFIDKVKSLFIKGEETVKKFTQYGHLSEMILIDLIYTHTKEVIDYLPILPFSPGNDNFDKLNVLFDGASYEQYLGGTNNGHNKGWHGLHHYVGQEISRNSIQIIFEDKPYIFFNSKKIPILNLHIHSKKLKNFVND
jgi:hypothetical protein